VNHPNATTLHLPSDLSQAIPFLADTSNNDKLASNKNWDDQMKTPNRERQRKWKQKQVANGMRTLTVMLPAEIKALIDRERKESRTTIAQIIERAVVNLLATPENASQISRKTLSNRGFEELPAEELNQISEDLNAIILRFQALAESKSAVSSNKKTVTSNVLPESRPEKSPTGEIYRLVRLLNNMEVNTDEIADTLNKRKFKTLSGSPEWKMEDVHEVIQDIHQKYGHINPLFPIRDNP
jgi:hypothetical protein